MYAIGRITQTETIDVPVWPLLVPSSICGIYLHDLEEQTLRQCYLLIFLGFSVSLSFSRLYLPFLLDEKQEQKNGKKSLTRKSQEK